MREELDEQELRRHLLLSHEISETPGYLVSATLVNLSAVRTVLDVGCGAGGWALDLACAFPHLQITGIDASARCIASAGRLAREGGFSNVTFCVQELHALDEGRVPGAPFDLIHLAFLAPKLLTMNPPALLRALWRLCRPGGTLCWTETEFPITNSPALERLITLTCDALEAAGHHFASPSRQALPGILDAGQRGVSETTLHVARRHLGITPMLGNWLHEAGYQEVQQVPTAIVVSSGAEAHPCFALQVEAFTRQVTPFLLAQGVITPDAYEQLCLQVEAEVQQETFCALCSLLSVLGQKPGAGNAAHL